jgi:hypothetical protein
MPRIAGSGCWACGADLGIQRIDAAGLDADQDLARLRGRPRHLRDPKRRPCGVKNRRLHEIFLVIFLVIFLDHDDLVVRSPTQSGHKLIVWQHKEL